MKKTMSFSDTIEATSAPVPVTPPRPLDLALSPASLRNIAHAEVAFDDLVRGHEVSSFDSRRDLGPASVYGASSVGVRGARNVV